jgi:hypothetical protein
MPTNANRRTIEACPTCEIVGSVIRRKSVFSDQTPPITRNNSGTSFAAVIASTRRIPGLMPRTLIIASAANSAARSTARTELFANAGQITPAVPANAAATDATDKHAVTAYRYPPRKPANPPNAVSIYA